MLMTNAVDGNDGDLVVLPLVEGRVEVSGVGEDLVEGGFRHVAVELVVPGCIFSLTKELGSLPQLI